ncbi:MAG: TIR domain-containing protein [Lachnospiraceae bacterium]|nr:TIR domain-containing protein [Lachnospiraceae bacterium]
MADIAMPKPYEGKEKYIFVSYSHKDIDRVIPIVNRLMMDGFRVWYDDGISPGTEWPEVIAQHLNDCELFIAFLSNSYMDSFNCKREIDFAVRKRKTFLAVFLEETELSLGVEMQISTVQSADYYKMSQEAFLESLYNLDVIKSSGCRMEPGEGSAAQQATVSEEQAAANQATMANAQIMADQVAILEAQVSNTQPASAQQTMPQSQPSNVAKEKAAKPKKKTKIFIPILVGVLVLLGVAGAIIGLNLSKSKQKAKTSTNKYALEIADATITARVLRKEAKGKDIKRIKIENCEFSIKDSQIWSEILSDKVTEITVTGCNMTSDEAEAILQNAPGVKTLDFSDNLIHTISFKSNPKLEKIDIRNNILTNIDKTNLENLKTLYVDTNQLTDLDFLETAIHLQTLTANENSLESIDTLKNCSLLTKVCLADNSISDVTALKASQDTIKDLNLANNKIADIGILNPMPELVNISVDNNLLISLYLVGSEKLSYLSARNNLIDSLNGDFDELTYIDMADNCLSGDYYFLYSTKLKNAFFENNKITELFFYGAEYRSGNFSVYNNPLVKLDLGAENTSYALYVTYNEDIGPKLETKNGKHLYLLDCPYDARVAYEKGWTQYNVDFPEETEIVEKVEELRKPFGQ